MHRKAHPGRDGWSSQRRGGRYENAAHETLRSHYVPEIFQLVFINDQIPDVKKKRTEKRREDQKRWPRKKCHFRLIGVGVGIGIGGEKAVDQLPIPMPAATPTPTDRDCSLN